MSKKYNKDTKDRDTQISKAVLASMPDEHLEAAFKFFENYSDFKRIGKLYDTYIVGVETALANTKDGKIYAKYNQDGAVTGRLSNSGASFSKRTEDKLGISFHTMPREQIDFNIRLLAGAPDDWKFITADEKAMELRVLAHNAKEEKMIEAFRSGRDLHLYSASMAFNKHESLITKEERQIAKEVSFLTIYGGSAYTLANKRRIAEEKAADIINSWLEGFPGVPRYMNTIRDYINQHKYAISIFGRRRNLPNIDSPSKSVVERAFRQGLNFTVQSPASDILGCCFIGIHEKLKKYNFKGRVFGQVHDSVEAVAPENEVKDIVEIMRDEMVNTHYMRKNFGINLLVPLEVDIEVGTNFGNGIKWVTPS